MGDVFAAVINIISVSFLVIVPYLFVIITKAH